MNKKFDEEVKKKLREDVDVPECVDAVSYTHLTRNLIMLCQDYIFMIIVLLKLQKM